uniref:monoamine oxidase n=2 Tax=Drosophila rhopaloa TaxID=1041015 RepID=A0A6P4F261_DRORH
MDLPFGTQTPELDVLIVGAGLSGLASALKIQTKESTLKVRIIEASDRLGGQLGQNAIRFVDGEQKDMLDFLTLIQLSPRRRRSDNDRLRRCWDLDRGLTALPAKFELGRYIEMLDLRMPKFRSKRFNLRERVSNMDQHICHHLFFNKSRNFMLNLVELVCGLPANEVDYDVFMSVCSSCGGLKMLIDFYFTHPSSFYEVSTQQLIENILEQMQFTTVTLNCRAVKVEHFKNYVQVTDEREQKHTAQAVILAIPWNKVQQLEFDPRIPKAFLPPLATKSGHNPRRLITQFHLRYGKSVWAELGYSGNFLSSQPMVSGHECRMSTFCGYMLHSPEEQDDVLEDLMDALAEQFGEEMRQPLECQCSTDELSVAMHKPQTKPWHRVIWSSSSAVGTSYRSLMGGAVQSGVRAAVNALFVVRPQVVSWKDMLDERQNRTTPDGVRTGRLRGLLSRLNLYNVTFYSFFVLGLIWLLNLGYCRASAS